MTRLETEIIYQTQQFQEESQHYEGGIVPSFDEAMGTYFSCADVGRLKGQIDAIRASQIRYYRDLTSYRPQFKGIVIFVKRVIRKLVRFIGEPMAGDAMYTKMMTENALDTVYEELVALQKQSVRYDAALARYEQQLTALRKENQALSLRLANMKIDGEEAQV